MVVFLRLFGGCFLLSCVTQIDLELDFPLHLSSATCLVASWSVSGFLAHADFQVVNKCFKLTRNCLSVSSSPPPTDFFDRSFSHCHHRSFIVLFHFFFKVKNALMLLLLVD